MLLRYSYRLDPSPAQREALARAFGCARVVFNDALAARRAAHEAGEPYLSGAELSRRLTASKNDPARAWLGEVSAVVLQQALADLNAAYRHFFASVTGKRAGPKAGPPRFRSRKTRGRRSGSPPIRGSACWITGGCACRRSATWRSAGPAACRRPRRR